MRSHPFILSAAMVAVLASPACKQDELTHEEAVEAIDEASSASQAGAVTDTPVEISTHFTLGEAAEQAAAELKTFLVSELPCATVSISGATVTTDWGAAGGGCTYRGQTYSGTTSFTVKRTDASTVEVDHTWTDFSNGKVKVSGTAVVEWSAADASRHVQHSLTWTRLSDGRTGTGTGDRTQRLIDPSQGLSAGVRVDGNRHWSGARGEWNLAITGVEMRPQDPVPQAGTYQLTTPSDKNLSLSFSRQSADAILVTVSGPKRSFSFVVRESGDFSDG